MELGGRRGAGDARPLILMPSLPHPVWFGLFCFDANRSWTFVTGASLLAGPSNYCQHRRYGKAVDQL